MLLFTRLLVVFLYVCCGSTTVGSDDHFLESLMAFSQNLQKPDLIHKEVQDEQKAPYILVNTERRLPTPMVKSNLKSQLKSPLSEKRIMSFGSSVQWRPFKGDKIVHTKYFFIPHQPRSSDAQHNLELNGARESPQANGILPRTKVKTGEAKSLSVEHILLDSSVMVSTVCVHMRQDFVSEEPVAGKFTLVNTNIKKYTFLDTDTRPKVRGLFFPNNLAHHFAGSYGSRVAASIAYLGICIVVNLVFNVA